MSDCVCLSSDFDGEMPDFFSSGWVTSRKPHKCCECGREIAKGQRVERASGKWDGEVEVFYTCSDCQDIRLSLYCGGGFVYGLLWEDVHSQLFEEGGFGAACLDKLATIEAKQYLQRRWWDWVEARIKDKA